MMVCRSYPIQGQGHEPPESRPFSLPPFIMGAGKWPQILKFRGQYYWIPKAYRSRIFYFCPTFCVTWLLSWQYVWVYRQSRTGLIYFLVRPLVAVNVAMSQKWCKVETLFQQTTDRKWSIASRIWRHLRWYRVAFTVIHPFQAFLRAISVQFCWIWQYFD